MRPEPFAEVEITHDDLQQRVRGGQRGYLLDWLRDPEGGEDGAAIELHSQPDRKDPVVTVPQSLVRAVVDAPAGEKASAKRRAG